MNSMLRLYLVIMLLIPPAFAGELDDCGNNEQARLLVELIRADKEQNRTDIRCNRMLTVAAEAKAKKMAEFGLVLHNLGGSPNTRLKELGYKLPKDYGWQFNSNQVEAIAGGYPNAKSVWRVLKRSDAHRAHLLGELEFCMEQDEIGAAFVKKWESPHIEYWVVYLTKGYEKNQSYSEKFKEILNKASFSLKK